MKTTIVAVAITVAALTGSAAKAKSVNHHHSNHAVAVQQQIACTVLGCQTVPAACHPKEEHSPGGIPTGYDTIVCPPGVWPLK
jgi:hypothetical protein